MSETLFPRIESTVNPHPAINAKVVREFSEQVKLVRTQDGGLFVRRRYDLAAQQGRNRLDTSFQSAWDSNAQLFRGAGVFVPESFIHIDGDDADGDDAVAIVDYVPDLKPLSEATTEVKIKAAKAFSDLILRGEKNYLKPDAIREDTLLVSPEKGLVVVDLDPYIGKRDFWWQNLASKAIDSISAAMETICNIATDNRERAVIMRVFVDHIAGQCYETSEPEVNEVMERARLLALQRLSKETVENIMGIK